MKWTRWLLIGVTVAIVLAVGGPFVYIHFIEGKAPAPLSIGSSPAPSGSSESLDGSWKVASGSVAGYRVKEVLMGQDNTAVGRTSDITGSVVVNGTVVKSGSFTADLTTVHSDSARYAYTQMALLIRESAAGSQMETADILKLLYLLIDVVAQVKSINGRRVMTEIYYDPLRKRKLLD